MTLDPLRGSGIGEMMTHSYKFAYCPQDRSSNEGLKVPEQFVFMMTCNIRITPQGGDQSQSRYISSTFHRSENADRTWVTPSPFEAAALVSVLNLILQLSGCGIRDLRVGVDFYPLTEIMDLFREHVKKHLEDTNSFLDEEESTIINWALEDYRHPFMVLALIREWSLRSLREEIGCITMDWKPELRYLNNRMKEDLYHIVLLTARFQKALETQSEPR